MESWLIAVCLTAVIGITLLVLGWRGRRVDDHPLCRRCGFDLTGRAPDSTRCAECGSDLGAPRAIRVGHRRRRGGAIVGGLALALPALLVLAAVVLVRSRDIELTPYKPDWLLARDVTSGNPAAIKSFAELHRRLATGPGVSDGSVAAVAAVCLGKQGDLTLPWDPAWGKFLEAARATRQLPDEDWARYARQGIELELRLRSPRSRLAHQAHRRKVYRTPELGVRNNRIADAAFVVLWDCDGFSVDDGQPGPPVYRPEPAAGFPADGRIDVSARGDAVAAAAPLLDLAETDRLPLALHVLHARLRLRVFDADRVPKAAGRVGRDARPIPPDPAKQILETNFETSVAFIPVRDVEEPQHAKPTRRGGGSTNR